MKMTMDQITAAYPNVAKLEEAAHEEIMCRECCDTSDKWQDEASPEAVLALVGLVKSLAAENVGLKSAMSLTLEHVSVTDAGQAGVAAMIINDALHNSETPATNRFVAEMKAQGVDMAIEHLTKKFEDTGRIGVPVMALEHLAKQLREVGQ